MLLVEMTRKFALPTAEGLKSFLVTNQQEIEQRIEEGTTNRSIAATNMNETSSRAHTIVGVEIIQKVLSTENFSIKLFMKKCD